jgi:hypothetical protein
MGKTSSDKETCLKAAGGRVKLYVDVVLDPCTTRSIAHFQSRPLRRDVGMSERLTRGSRDVHPPGVVQRHPRNAGRSLARAVFEARHDARGSSLWPVARAPRPHTPLLLQPSRKKTASLCWNKPHVSVAATVGLDHRTRSEKDIAEKVIRQQEVKLSRQQQVMLKSNLARGIVRGS